jgi:predicted nucleic acid-binding protein
MRALLDVNVLLALLDQAHVHHVRARKWQIRVHPDENPGHG